MKKIVEGWLGGYYEDLGLYETKVESERCIGGKNLDDLTSEFQNMKVKITIETIKE